jgi:hypothetical protein
MHCLHTGEAHEFRNIPGNEARAGHDFSARAHEERSVDDHPRPRVAGTFMVLTFQHISMSDAARGGSRYDIDTPVKPPAEGDDA